MIPSNIKQRSGDRIRRGEGRCREIAMRRKEKPRFSDNDIVSENIIRKPPQRNMRT
jgi:hypothetical protein